MTLVECALGAVRNGNFLDSLDRTGIPKIFLVFYFGGEAAKIKNQKINFL
ncbi:MAG TPA: hypothetical protein VF313_11315 [Anaerolineaceae bacterium]